MTGAVLVKKQQTNSAHTVQVVQNGGRDVESPVSTEIETQTHIRQHCISWRDYDAEVMYVPVYGVSCRVAEDNAGT